ncbi:L,D-transpeptidase family protein [Streptomyces sp. CC219B]|uniref:L,D-transpeptidase family protein n=1 Tax=Streptomyces sp. CC219B TaxID=3044574 RepID=UPI0024A86B29|nr:L,D-transpeptidase family protein [Streptomyces sp. CC219B]
MICTRIACRGVAVVMAAMFVVPVGGSAASASAADPSPSPSLSAATGAQDVLVPGAAPRPGVPWTVDTPDQALPPAVYTPSAREDAVEPREAVAGAYDRVEHVPLGDAVVRVACSKRTGPYQRQVERWLKLPVDGKQSAADCRAVRAFQVKHRIKPATGFAGPVTWATMQLVGARKNPNAAKKCPVRSYRVACVDLSRQLTWVQKGEKVVYGPVPMRSGRAGYRTRGGWHKVYWKHKNHVSTLYHQPMPYAQFFSGGQAFHAVYGTIYTTVGSMGCVNLRIGDARKLWGVLKTGDRVYVWGRRPGT